MSNYLTSSGMLLTVFTSHGMTGTRGIKTFNTDTAAFYNYYVHKWHIKNRCSYTVPMSTLIGALKYVLRNNSLKDSLSLLSISSHT